jgi:peptidoglycan lytic transglycosylase
MYCISCARNSNGDIAASHILLNAPLFLPTGFRNVVRLFAVALTAAALAACAQSSVVTDKSELLAVSRQASLENNRKASFVTNRRVAVMKMYSPAATDKHAAETQFASYGLASFYTDAETASGEKFDPYKMTAAHPSLPFGTRLRVTNLATGRFVTVRVNDRGPFVPGRVVDVSYTAAETLGITEQGIAKVKLDVVK